MKTTYSHANPQKLGQKLVAPFQIEVFDSHNTSQMYDPLKKDAWTPDHSEENAILKTKSFSVPFKAILHDSQGHWIEYVKGEVSSWSVSEA